MSRQYMTTGASVGRLAQKPSTWGRMSETASVLSTHPPAVTVSVMMPKEAAELASLSALLAPMKRAEVSSTAAKVEPGEKMAVSLERLGCVSKFNLNKVLSPSRRGVRRELSS